MSDLDPAVAEVVAGHRSQHDREVSGERLVLAATERTVLVVSCIRQPFTVRDVAECVRAVLTRDGFTQRQAGSSWDVVRATLREMEKRDSIAVIRRQNGATPMMFVRTLRGQQ